MFSPPFAVREGGDEFSPLYHLHLKGVVLPKPGQYFENFPKKIFEGRGKLSSKSLKNHA
jgi:hypothetical protein